MNRDSRRRRSGDGPGGLVMWGLLLALALPFSSHSGSQALAQSIVGGEVAGTVSDEAGRPIRGAAISLRDARSGISWTQRTRTNGVFSFSAVSGGSYEVRVEALGYRPLAVLGVGVTPGVRSDVPVRLIAEPPPLTRTDTLRMAGGGGAPGIGLRADWASLSSLPDRLQDMTALLRLSSWSDGRGGLEGLPASYTTLFADGEPYRGIRHPALLSAGAPSGLLFPRTGLQSVSVRTGLEDIEWAGAPGGIVSLETSPPRGEASAELYGFWSGAPTWGNEVAGDASSLLSAWGGGSVSVPLDQGSMALSLSFQGGMVETPNLFWRNDYFTQQLVTGGSDQGTRTEGFGSALARTGWAFGEAGQVSIRASASGFKNETDRVGTPQLGYGSELTGEGTDGSLGVIVTFPMSEKVDMEIRGSGSMSSRTWEEGEGGLAGAYLVGDRALIGTNPSFAGSSDYGSFAVTPVAHYRSGENRLKGGVRLEYNTYDISYVDQSSGAFFFGSRRALQTGQGSAISVNGAVPSESFSVFRMNLFGQYRWTPFPGLDLTTGISYKQEVLPMEDVQLANGWAQLTGIPNVRADNKISSTDGRVGIRWDLGGNGRTWLVGGMGIEHGILDPLTMNEVLTLDGQVTVKRSLGSGLDWEDGQASAASSATGRRLALFGSGLEAPRTARGALGLYHAFSQGIQFGISGVFRRTESILRRSDLNRLLVPSGTDQDGRPLFGDLRIVSGVLAADPESNRRFPGYESVWVHNADGWSDYLGITASMEATLPGDGVLSLSYTWSETTDNWVGASQAGALAQLATELPEDDWDEATSDFDIPHRLTALATLPLPLKWGGAVTGFYSFRSDLPFTPMVAAGLDANGDGSPFNDVAFVPESGSALDALAQEWGCLDDSRGTFAARNSCRGDPVHTLDLRLTLGLPPIAGVSSELVVDGLNLADTDMGIRDNNLLLLRSGSVNQTADGIEVPYKVNPGFGSWVFRGDTGRMLRVGIRIGGGR